MVLPPKSSQHTARDDQKAQRELASAVRPVRLMLAASILLPITLFGFASWLSFHQHLVDARDRVELNLNTVYEHALKVFETFELSARYLDELTGDLSDAEIRKREAELSGRLKSINDRLPQLRDLWVDQRHRRAAGVRHGFSDAEDQPLRPRLFSGSEGQRQGRHLCQRSAEGTRGRYHFLRVVQPAAVGLQGQIRRRHHRVDRAGIFHKFLFRKLPPPGVFALIRDDGAILARFPDLSTRLEKLAPDSTVMRSIAAQSTEGVASGTSSFDGLTRIFAYRKMPNYKHLCGPPVSKARS